MASTRVCSIEGCGKAIHARGMCWGHDYRVRVYGDPGISKYANKGEALRWLDAHKGFRGDECLVWPFKSRDRNGYGLLGFRGAQVPASRVMCILAHGEPPSETDHAAHGCGNGHGGCVHPDHLRWASPKENEADKTTHGTYYIRGNKLTEVQVREIRRLKGVLSRSEIAKRFGVTPSNVWCVQTGKSWAWLDANR